MSKLKEKSEYMAMRVNGFLGWIHRMVMLITFPIRKFWAIVTILVVVLAILIAIPLFYGIPFRDIWDWYMIKMPTHEFVAAKDKTLFGAENKIKQITHTIKEIVPGKKSATEEQKNKKAEKMQFVAWNVAEFRKAKYKPKKTIQAVQDIKDNFAEVEKKTVEKIKQILPQKDEVKPENSGKYIKAEQETSSIVNKAETLKENKQNEIIASQMAKRKIPVSEYKGSLDDYYTKFKSKDLSYLKVPEIVEGEAKEIGPNSMYVNGKFVFLYGIYSHPRRHDLKAATQYLHNVIHGKKVYCEVVAYSQKTQSATALCFVDGMFINKALTEHNLAKNVALK